MPPRVVIVLGGFVKNHSQIMCGADPFRGIIDAALQGSKDFTAGQQHIGLSSYLRPGKEDFG